MAHGVVLVVFYLHLLVPWWNKTTGVLVIFGDFTVEPQCVAMKCIPNSCKILPKYLRKCNILQSKLQNNSFKL